MFLRFSLVAVLIGTVLSTVPSQKTCTTESTVNASQTYFLFLIPESS